MKSYIKIILLIIACSMITTFGKSNNDKNIDASDLSTVEQKLVGVWLTEKRPDFIVFKDDNTYVYEEFWDDTRGESGFYDWKDDEEDRGSWSIKENQLCFQHMESRRPACFNYELKTTNKKTFLLVDYGDEGEFHTHRKVQ